MPSSQVRPARMAAVMLAGALALAGCSLSSDNVSCSGTKCTATLSGDGASAEILGTKTQAPFRVYLLQNPTRVVVEVADPS